MPAALLGAPRIDAHRRAHDGAADPEPGAVPGAGGRPLADGEELRGVVGMVEELEEEDAPDVRSELLVEERLQLDRAPALHRVDRIERGLGVQRLQALQDAGRVGHDLVPDRERRRLRLARQPQHARHVPDREQRAPHVRHALPVEPPAHLLVEVRHPELPQDRRTHDSHPQAALRRCRVWVKDQNWGPVQGPALQTSFTKPRGCQNMSFSACAAGIFGVSSCGSWPARGGSLSSGDSGEPVSNRK